MRNRRHDNLIYGYGCLDFSGPLDPYDTINSPRVYPRPTNLRQIVSLWGRLKAAWEVFSLNAVAVRWYDDKNRYRYGSNWYEQLRPPRPPGPTSGGQRFFFEGASWSALTDHAAPGTLAGHTPPAARPAGVGANAPWADGQSTTSGGPRKKNLAARDFRSE